jgi:hypothetical protein
MKAPIRESKFYNVGTLADARNRVIQKIMAETNAKVLYMWLGLYDDAHRAADADSNPDEAYRRAEAYARKICFTDEEYQELKAHDFYVGQPFPKQPETEEELYAELEEAEREGYVSDEETEFMMNLWKN